MIVAKRDQDGYRRWRFLSRHCVEQAAPGVFYIGVGLAAIQMVCGETKEYAAFRSASENSGLLR
ncbi:hypothetical protein [Wenzhouxiangella sp. EGI_FJ10305]|uniref:hypothetical protein n=1 Tax=Wenzhouxiangella sp. EGI_FJ10305 TaxID=3243768 RepID=UPI0035D5BD67